MANLRQVVKRIAWWTVPAGVYEWVGRHLPIGHRESTAFEEERQAVLAANAALRNSHRGQRCFILATGPSIRAQNLKPLRDEVCIAVSNFFMHPDYAYIQPRYHCIAPYHPPITEDAWQEWMDELNMHTQSILVFGHSDRERNERGGRFADREHYYLAFRDPAKVDTSDGIDLTQPVADVHSVPTMALQLAMYMGFSKIYLLGCDHDWILHIERSQHFYDESQHAFMRHGYDEWNREDFASYCQRYVTLWDQYKWVRAIAQRQGVQIFNATPGSLLDVFPRADFARIVGPVRGLVRQNTE